MTLRVRLIWAVVLALLVGFGSYSYLRDLRAEVTVLVAARDIPARAVITAEMVTAVSVDAKAKSEIAPSAFTAADKVVGAVAVQEIPKGEVLRNNPAWITREEGAVQAANRQRLSYFLPKNARATTILVDGQGLVAGRVKEGDLVDVLFTSRDDTTGGIYTVMILQQVLVLGVDGAGSSQSVPNLSEGKVSQSAQYHVTVLVSPEQALDLTLAKRRGTVDLVLSSRTPDPVNLPPVSPLKFPKIGGSP